MSDPVKRAILRDLLRRERVPSGDLVLRMRERFGMSRTMMSNHITALRRGKLIRRAHGNLTLAHAHELQIVLTATARYAQIKNAESGRTIAAELVELDGSQIADWDPAEAASSPASPSAATFGHESLIQRDASLNGHPPPAGAPSHDPFWIWVTPTTTGPRRLAPHQPARYIPPDAHVVLINAHWIPFVKIVQACAPEPQDYARAFRRLQMIVELEIAQILIAIAPKRAIAADSASSDGLNETLHARLRKRMSHIEAQLGDAVMLLRSAEQ